MSGLELARPVALWGLALGLPILLFHLYARRRRRVIVPFVGLLREALGPEPPRARFKQLREAASLLLRLTALALLVLALGGLRPARADTPPVDLMIVVDADVTTGTREASGRLRLSEGLSLAAAHAQHHTDGRVGLMLAGSPVEVVAPLGTKPAEIARRVELLRERLDGRPRGPDERALRVPATRDTDLARAVGWAAEQAGEAGPGKVVVVSARALAPTETPGVEVAVVGAGRARDDQSFDDLAVAAAGDGYAVRAHLRTEGDAASVRRVIARMGDAVVHDEEVTIEPDGGAEVLFTPPAPSGEGAWLTVSLEGSDAFARGDTVTAWLAPPRKPSVLVVTGAAPRAFTSLVVSQMADEIDLARSGRVKVSDFAEAEMRDVIVVDGVALPDGALRPGAYVFIAPLRGALPFEVGDPIEDPLVWRTESHHPLVRWLDFSPSYVKWGTGVSGKGLVPLAYADDTTIVAEGERDGVRYIVLGLDPARSDLAIRMELPLFLRRAIRRLAEAPVAPLKPFYRTGEALRPRLPLPEGPDASVWWGMDDTAAARSPVRARVDPRGTAWRVPAGAQGKAEVRTGDAAEGFAGRTAFVDLAPDRTIVPVRPPGTPPPARVRAEPAEQTWMWWLIVGGLLLLALDLIVLPRARS